MYTVMASTEVADGSTTRSLSPLLSLPSSDAFQPLYGNHLPSSESSERYTKKRRLARAESTWDHFREPQGIEDCFDREKRRLHYCTICTKWSTGVSSNARYHLEKTHHVFINEAPSGNDKKRQQAVNVLFTHLKEKDVRKIKEEEEATLRGVVNQEAFFEAQNLLITRRRLPYNFVTWPETYALLYSVNYLAPEFMITASSSASSHVKTSFTKHKATVKRLIHGARSLIHFSCDLWTSPNAKSLLGIHIQWVDEQYKLRKALIGLPRIRYSHSGETQARLIMHTIRDFELARSVGYFVGDNATSNDTCIKAIAATLLPEYGVHLNPTK